jgi:nitric oxide reductase NorQ protein
MAYPSHIARDALRRALRNHPDCQTILQGRLVGSLKLSELQCGVAALGMDPDAIAADAVNSSVSPLPTHRATITAMEEDDTGDTGDVVAPVAPDPIVIDAVETELAAIRGLIGTGGFSALDDRLRELVIAANKPAVEILVPVPVDRSPGAIGIAPGDHVSRPTGKTATWRSLFGVKGDLGKRDTQLWDGTHPSTPKVNSRYLWPHPATATVLTQIARSRNVMMYGPAGTGKTEFAQQLAAVTGRPFVLISCDAGTDAATLVGMTVPDIGGSVRWQDGQLTKAIRTPGAIVCLDEPSVARAGALMVLQNVLANRQLFIGETGERVSVASGVVFLATDNTNGTGGGSRRGYTDTNRLNAAFLDRFGVRVKVDYLPADREADVIVGYTGCTVELARLLVSAATVTRAAADDQTLSHGIGLRRLLSWAELLMDGIGPEEAFQAAVLNCAAEQDVETLREQCLLTYDKRTVAAALNPSVPLASDPSITNPTGAGRAAASDFNTYRI